MRRLTLVAVVAVVFSVAGPAESACPKPKPQAAGSTPLSSIRVVPTGNNHTSASATQALNRAISRWNAACNHKDVPRLSKTGSGAVTFTVKFMKGNYNLPVPPGFVACASVPISASGAEMGSATISIFERTRSGIDCRPYVDEIVAHEIGHAYGLDHSPCSDNIMHFPAQDIAGNVPKAEECSAVDDFWLTHHEDLDITPFPPDCECSFSSDCDGLPGTGTGIWACLFCQCILLQSPLVLHLPDYFSTSGADPDWWEDGFCGPEVPTVCLDWLGNGEATCTGWMALDSEIAFIVALSDDDLLDLADGLLVPAEPWRHFFGNITIGPGGGYPYAHGFEALADFCGLDPASTSKIDFTEKRGKPILWHGKTMDLAECGLSLHVWADRSGDGVIAPDEILEFRDLGIDSLSDVGKTDKKDRCGNVFPFESHATCYDLTGNVCGTWFDVFFVPR